METLTGVLLINLINLITVIICAINFMIVLVLVKKGYDTEAMILACVSLVFSVTVTVLT